MNQQEHEDLMIKISDTLKKLFPDKLHTLMIFDDGNSSADYVSNASRDSMILALREMADQLEANQDLPAIDPATPPQ